VVEDRAGSLGGLGVGDRGPDHRLEHVPAETLLQRRQRLARVDRAHVREVQQHAQQRELGVEAVAGQFDHLHRLLYALQREVLGLGRDQRVVGRDERVDRQQTQRRRAVDQDQVVLGAGLGQRLAQRQLAPHLAAQHQLRLGQAQVGRHDVLQDRAVDRGATGQHVGDRRLGVGRQVEVVGQVPLRIEIDGQGAQAGASQYVGERADGRRLAGAALL